MRMKRRVTVEIEHRELTLTAEQDPVVGRQLAARPTACPVCGSLEIVSLAQALAKPRFTAELLEANGAPSHVHLGRSPSGDLWICAESLHCR
jgi:hypothetical protein